MKVRDTARLHPETVSNAEEHIIRRIPKRGSRVVVNSIKVDPRVWKTAMELADGDRSRIEVHDATEVVVKNQSKRKG